MRDTLEKAIEIFAEICDLAPEEQARRLRTLEAEDPELRTMVEEFLLGDRNPDGRIDRRADDFVPLESVTLERYEEPVSAEVLARLSDRGKQMAHYRLEGEIGRGGMGAIFNVWDEDIERRLAMKILGSGEAPHSSVGRRRLARFLDEARVTGQLDHPGIVPLHDLGIDSKGRAYFTMKYVKGRTLQEVFELVARGEEGWTQTRALGVLLRICEAMSYAHAKGVVHRDLKPSNVMVGRFGEVYVMDWGVAWLRSAKDGRDLRPRPPLEVPEPTGEIRIDSAVVTMDGTIVGTPYFMSPEQARGGWIDERSDVYALGAMIYALLSGRPPYREKGEERTPYEILERVIEGPPGDVRPLSRVPAELEAICQKAMARAAEDRYASVSELGDDLRAYLEGHVVRAHETGSIAELRKWMRRNRGLASALAAAFVILIAGLATTWILKEAALSSEESARDERAKALRLAGFIRLDHLTEQADELWPPHPENIPRYAAWLDLAQRTVQELDYTLTAAELEEVRQRAVPQAADERERNRRLHPRYPEYLRLEAELASFHSARAIRDGTAEPEDFAPDEGALPQDALRLLELARTLVAPEREIFGREPEGLALAGLAGVYATSDEELAEVSGALAWGYFANGKDEDALAEAEAALELAGAAHAGRFGHELEKLRGAIADARNGSALVRLEERHAALESEISARRDWRFEEPADRLWHDLLTKSLETIEAIDDSDSGLIEGVSPRHGWGVARRLGWAEQVAELTVSGADAARRWRAAVASIADPNTCPAYGGLVIEPQVGLVPIGRAPNSGLWEFAHPQSGAIAERGGGGKLSIGAETGLVFVLLPAGSFSMGAQNKDAGAENFDAQARSSEGPVHRVTLSPFFLSKYELTQAQWVRLAGENPSFYQPAYRNVSGTTLLHPVDKVSWFECERVCRWLGLRLPTEAEWEYAARGGSGTSWWSGGSRDSLLGRVNLADQSARRGRAPWSEIQDWPELDDGYVVHAPVASFEPNAFGLYNVHGNVWEWCRDVYDPDYYSGSPVVDPLNESLESSRRVRRGGSFRSTSNFARSAFRQGEAPESAISEIGLRPARPLVGSR